jgi:calcineurin-like phosphoesterase family protein
MYWFTADEHYGHFKMIEYANRPFSCIEEMNAELIERHNSVVKPKDRVIHAGDFAWGKTRAAVSEYIRLLNGQHTFLKGSHDYWLNRDAMQIWEETIKGQFLVVCHYAMCTWPRSHYNSWQLYGHSHGRMYLPCKQYDVGVDNNNYYPISFDEVKEIIDKKEDNPNYKVLVDAGKI